MIHNDLREINAEHDISAVIEAAIEKIQRQCPWHHADQNLTACISYLEQAKGAAIDAERGAADWEIAA